MKAALAENLVLDDNEEKDIWLIFENNNDVLDLKNGVKIELFFNNNRIGYVVYNESVYPLKKKHVVFDCSDAPSAAAAAINTTPQETDEEVVHPKKKQKCTGATLDVEAMTKNELEIEEKRLFEQWKKVHNKLLFF